MEERSFKWFLQEYSTRKGKINLLDTALCAGETVTSACVTGTCLFPKGTKIKHLLNSLLEIRSPMLGEYSPEKFVCVVYQKEGPKALTAKKILELPSGRVYSMKIKSIHVIPFDSVSLAIYKVLSVNRVGDVYCMLKRVFRGPYVHTGELCRKVKETALNIGEFIHKSSGTTLLRMHFDILIDDSGTLHLLKVYKIILAGVYKGRRNTRVPGHTVMQPFSNRPKREKSVTSFNVRNCPSSRLSNAASKDFLEMLAKTIDRTRKSDHKVLQRLSLPRLSRTEKESYTLDDLLEEMETSRPRTWLRDLIPRTESVTSPAALTSTKRSEAQLKPQRPSMGLPPFTQDRSRYLHHYQLAAAKRREKRMNQTIRTAR